ncbi:MAG: amidohydrolase [Oscillospiraceae bacterium]
MDILIKNVKAILPEKTANNLSVYISNGVIVSLDFPPVGFNADKIIDGTNKLLAPGFVNAHTHAYMSALRNKADDLSFMTWLFDNVMIMENKLTEEDAYWSMQLGCMEMLASGVTSFLDMHMFPNVTARAAVDSGMRAVLTRGLQGGRDSMEGGLLRLKQATDDINNFKGIETLGFMLAPHAPYTCDDYYLKEVAALADELHVGINTHLSESADEQKTIMERYNMTPTQLFDSCGILRKNTVCAHCVYLSKKDMDILAARGTSVAHNPASNMKLGNGFADVVSMRRHGINVCIGTDGAASNNNQSMLREIQLAALIHKGTSNDPTAITASEVFEMATLNGARALGLSDKVGEIRVGKRADLAMYDLTFPGFFPLGDAKSALCYSSAGLRADTVLVNGRVLLENGEYKTIDAEKVRFKINELTKRLGYED